jgi:hypothetical protein
MRRFLPLILILWLAVFAPNSTAQSPTPKPAIEQFSAALLAAESDAQREQLLAENKSPLTAELAFFESLIPYMEPSKRGSPYNQWQADHYKFFINEIFLYATASILKHRRFERLNELTVSGYYVAADSYRIKARLHDFIIFNTHSEALRYYNDRLPQKWNSIYAKFKNDRATRGDIKFIDLMQADFFLYILAQLKETSDDIFSSHWYPDTLPYAERMYQPFEIFTRAESKSFFDSLRVALGSATKEDPEKLALKLEANRHTPKWGLFSPKLEFFTALEKIAAKS